MPASNKAQRSDRQNIAIAIVVTFLFLLVVGACNDSDNKATPASSSAHTQSAPALAPVAAPATTETPAPAVTDDTTADDTTPTETSPPADGNSSSYSSGGGDGICESCYIPHPHAPHLHIGGHHHHF